MVQLSMLGVIALDYSLNQFMVAADQTYKDALFNVVIAYNEEIHPWTDAEWYAKIMGLYKNRGDDPEKFNAALRGMMENYSSRYFFDSPEEQLVATNEAGLHAYTTGLLPETDAAKQYCIEQYMARLGEKLQPVLEDVVKRIQYDSRKNFSSNAQELRQALNAPLEFEIIEEIPDGEKSKYAGCTVVLSRPNAPVGKGWTAALDKNGRVSLDATIVGYIQAGLPTQLRLWNKGDDPYKDAPALTQEFKVTEKRTVIPLGIAEEVVEDPYSGIYTGTYINNVFGYNDPVRIEVLGIYSDGKLRHSISAYSDDGALLFPVWGQLDALSGEIGDTQTEITFSPDRKSIRIVFYDYSDGSVNSTITAYRRQEALAVTKEASNQTALFTSITLDGTSKLRWSYTLNLWRQQPVMLYTAFKAMSVAAASFGLLVCFVRMGMDGFWAGADFLWRYLLIAFAAILVLMGISYLILCLLYKGKYTMLFEMDEAGILHTEAPEQRKKSKKLGVAAAVVGTDAGYSGAMGLAASGK